MQRNFIMKKRLLSFILCITILFGGVLSSCTSGKDIGENEPLDGTETFNEQNGETSNIPNNGEDNKDNTVNVTVTLKNSDGSILSQNEVLSGSHISEPTMPTVEGYTFIGWFENIESDMPYDFNTPITSDLTLIAKWEGGRSPDITITPTLMDADYEITRLNFDMSQKQIKASVYAKSDCRVVVKFIEEDLYFTPEFKDNKQYVDGCYAEGEITVTEEQKITETVMSITGTLPEYFVAEAVIVDADGNEISNSTFDITNTGRYETFDKKTVDDFSDEKKLVNFDGSKDNNFAVLADDVKMLTAKSVSTIVLDNNGNYVYWITEASDQIMAGDKIYIKSDDGVEALFKVGSVSADGNKLTVIPDKATEDDGYKMSDFYKFLKMNMRFDYIIGDGGNVEQLSSSGIATIDTLNIDPPKVNFQFKYGKVEAWVYGKLNPEIISVYDPIVFGEDYYECGIVLNPDLKFTVTFTLTTDDVEEPKEEKKDLMFEVPMPMIWGFSPKLEMGLSLEWELKVSVTATVTIEKRMGFKYNPVSGVTKICEGKGIDYDIDLDGEASLSIGPKINLGVAFLKEILVGEISVYGGIKVTATTEDNEDMMAAGAVHNCHTCISLAVDVFYDIGWEIVAMGFNKKAKIELLTGTILNLTVNLDTETWSKETEDSEFVHKKGECKNYTVKFYVYNRIGCKHDHSIPPEEGYEIYGPFVSSRPSWSVKIYKDGKVIYEIYNKGGIDYPTDSYPIYLDYDGIYAVVFDQTCKYWYDKEPTEGGNSEKYECEYENPTEIYTGQLYLVRAGDDTQIRFATKQADGSLKGLAVLLRPAKIN